MQKSFLFSLFLTLFVDQISKYLVLFVMDLRNLFYIEIFPPLLNFSMAWNYGINFGLFSGDTFFQRLVLIFLALIISGIVIYWTRKDVPALLGQISAGLLVGGALSNALDRVVFGAVADFLNMSCCGISNPFAFNIADIGIFAGAVGIVFFSGRKTEIES